MTFTRSSQALTGLASLLLAVAAAAQTAPSLPDARARRAVLGLHRGASDPSSGPSPAASLGDIDVLHYDLSVRLHPDGGFLDGTVTITFRSLRDELSVVELDLHSPEMFVRGVRRLDAPLPVDHVHADDRLELYFAGDLPDVQEEVVVAIDYVGRPRSPDDGGLPPMSFDEDPRTGAPRIWTFSEPESARGWWPCRDRPDDRATLDVDVEAPSELTVVSNGRLLGTTPGIDGHTISYWTHDHPIAPYAVSVSAAFYVRWSDFFFYTDPSGSERRMRVGYWAWPELTEWALQDWQVTIPMLEAFSEAFGTYPYANEKYGLVMFGEEGGMEHQTASSIGAGLVADISRGTGRFDNLLAHELAHHWWGNAVGIESFEHVWLKEGFATWSEAWWWEHEGGLPAYLAYLADVDRPLGGVEFAGTVQAPTDTFGDTVYYKGAWILHMLRWVLSSSDPEPPAEPVLQLLHAWHAEFGGKVANTEDFVDFAASFGAERGVDGLAQWFFPQWLRREGRPAFGLGWATVADGGFFETQVRIEQLQGGERYVMPVALRFELEDGSTTDRVVWTEGPSEVYAFETRAPVVGVQLDPDGWVLKTVTGVDVDRDDDGWPDWLDNCPDVANPEQEDRDRNGIPDACDPDVDYDEDGVVNRDDCAPADPGAWSLPEGPSRLRVQRGPDGTTRLLLDLPPANEQSPFVTDVACGSLAALRQGVLGGTCLATGHPEEVLDTTIPFGAAGTWYLSWPANACGAAAEPDAVPTNPCR